MRTLTYYGQSITVHELHDVRVAGVPIVFRSLAAARRFIRASVQVAAATGTTVGPDRRPAR